MMLGVRFVFVCGSLMELLWVVYRVSMWYGMVCLVGVDFEEEEFYEGYGKGVCGK